VVGRTRGSARTEAGEVIQMVDARAAILARLVLTLIYLQFTQMSRVAGLALAAVVVSTINTPAVYTDHANTVVWVYFTVNTFESYSSITS